MDEDIKTISNQTNIDDVDLIKTTYFKNNQNFVATIIELMDIKDQSRPQKTRTFVDELRDVLAEKEEIFKRVMEAHQTHIAPTTAI